MTMVSREWCERAFNSVSGAPFEMNGQKRRDATTRRESDKL